MQVIVLQFQGYIKWAFSVDFVIMEIGYTQK